MLWQAGAGAKSAAIGAAVATNDISNTIRAAIDGSAVTGNSIALSASSTASIDTLTVGGAGASSFALGGSVSSQQDRQHDRRPYTTNADVHAAGQISVMATDTRRSMHGRAACKAPRELPLALPLPRTISAIGPGHSSRFPRGREQHCPECFNPLRPSRRLRSAGRAGTFALGGWCRS